MSYAPRFRSLLDEGFTSADARAILRLEDRENDLLSLLEQPACSGAVLKAVEAELQSVQDRVVALTTPVAERRAA